MSAELFRLVRSSEPGEAADGPIDKLYVSMVYCLAGCADRLPVHRFETMEAARLGSRLLTEWADAY
jgi:hypothetical protein